MKNFIPDEQIERDLHWLIQHATDCAEARAERQYLDDYKKVLIAKIMKEHPHYSVSAQEREAYADPRYETHLKALKEAVERDLRMHYLRDIAEARQEAWRTLSATERAMKL